MPQPFIVLIGNPNDGFYAVGPFEDRETAQGYIGSEFDPRNMWVMELQVPAGEEEGA